MRISDWSSDVCSSDLIAGLFFGLFIAGLAPYHTTVYRRMRNRLRAYRQERNINKRNATETLELMLEWRVRALNAEYALEELARIYANQTCRHEVETLIADSVFTVTVIDKVLEE